MTTLLENSLRITKENRMQEVWGFYFKDTLGLVQSSHASMHTGPKILLDKQRVVAPQIPYSVFLIHKSVTPCIYTEKVDKLQNSLLILVVFTFVELPIKRVNFFFNNEVHECFISLLISCYIFGCILKEFFFVHNRFTLQMY